MSCISATRPGKPCSAMRCGPTMRRTPECPPPLRPELVAQRERLAPLPQCRRAGPGAGGCRAGAGQLRLLAGPGQGDQAARLGVPGHLPASLGKTEQAVIATLPEPYVVLFESGSDRLDGVGLNVATAASRAARLRAPGAHQRDRLRRSVGIARPATRRCRCNAPRMWRRRWQRAGVAPELIDVQARGARAAAEDGRRVEIAFDS